MFRAHERQPRKVPGACHLLTANAFEHWTAHPQPRVTLSWARRLSGFFVTKEMAERLSHVFSWRSTILVFGASQKAHQTQKSCQNAIQDMNSQGKPSSFGEDQVRIPSNWQNDCLRFIGQHCRNVLWLSWDMLRPKNSLKSTSITFKPTD